MVTGTLKQLHAAFKLAGWLEADRLGLAGSWRMVRAFFLNSAYEVGNQVLISSHRCCCHQ
jgi:hypothetical protein